MFSGNDLILTQNGYEKISTLPTSCKIQFTFDKTKINNLESSILYRGRGHLYSLQVGCWDQFHCDSTHAFYINRFDSGKHIPMWKPLSRINAMDFIGIPINLKMDKPEFSRYKKELNKYIEKKWFWTFLGLILGKCKIDKCKIYVPNNSVVKSYLKLLNVEYEERGDFVRFISISLSYLLKLFHDDNNDIVLPGFIVNYSREYLILLLRYVISESKYINEDYQVFTSKSRETIFVLASCIAKLYNTIYLIDENIIANQERSWNLRFSKNIQNNSYGLFDNGFLWYKPLQIYKDAQLIDLYKIHNKFGKGIVNGAFVTL